MLWELVIYPADGETDREAERVRGEAGRLHLGDVGQVRTARSYLIEGAIDEASVRGQVAALLANPIVERFEVRRVDVAPAPAAAAPQVEEINVLLKPGVTDNVAGSARRALRAHDAAAVDAVATVRKYWFEGGDADARERLVRRALANDAIETWQRGPLALDSIALGQPYTLDRQTIPLRAMDDAELDKLSKEGLLSLSTIEMRTVQDYFQSQDRDPTDIELETIAQTWSEHCSHKTLAGRIAYTETVGGETTTRQFDNMLKETVFAATQTIRRQLGGDDWCVSVFSDNAGVVTFNDDYDVCIKVETHNHPSALEPYGGANTGLGGVIRDPLGTGRGAKPVCNTDVFCFAPPETPPESLPPGVLHPRAVMEGVVAGVRDYGNRMGIPTVNGAVCFDERYLGNPLVYCGNVALLPRGMADVQAAPGDLIVAVGGRTGRDGIHGATFSSIELDEHSESTSGGAVQIGNAVTEKMVADVILQARDRGLYRALTDCGAGGFSSAVGEMAEHTGAEVWLEKAPLKYDGLSYTEIWISEAQERMVLAVPPEHLDEFLALAASEDVEAVAIGRFTDDRRLVLHYDGTEVGTLDMDFLHDGRPPVVREATWSSPTESDAAATIAGDVAANNAHLLDQLGNLDVCSKEWIIRQYDHEVQGGSVVKPLVGERGDGPSDAAVVQPDLRSERAIVVGCGIDPQAGDHDPYHMACGAIDEAIRNVVACGADPDKVAILDNFCWGNTERAETLGSLVRAAIGCHDAAVAMGTPFVSGKDSLYNEFSYDSDVGRQTVAIPATLLITALGQIDRADQAVTMDLKPQPGSRLVLVGGSVADRPGQSYHGARGNRVLPEVDFDLARRSHAAVHQLASRGNLLACHDLSEGGLAVALTEMAFAGEMGAEVTLSHADELFTETPSRYLLQVDESVLRSLDPTITREIGTVSDGQRVQISGPDGPLVDIDWAKAKRAWQAPLDW